MARREYGEDYAHDDRSGRNGVAIPCLGACIGSNAMINRIFSVDNPKAAKAAQYGYLNAIHYMAPASLSGYNMCADSTPQCRELCLGWHSGQAGMARGDELNNVRKSRIAKSRRYMESRDEYMRDVIRSIELLERKAEKISLKLCVRMCGSQDIPFERVPVVRDGLRFANVMEAFRGVQFIDYTKLHNRFKHALPDNYRLTYSRAEGRDAIALRLAASGHSVAVVSARHRPAIGRPLEQWCGIAAIDGDAHDLRHLDPAGAIVALSPKGAAAKRMARADTTGEGFVLT